eukprot:CAMPEP_0119466300 /NCGR_PEP_ID=MMETSP1344-20130328/1023_1 /TAXON_ID=236787 /ORGANISM="Florenciella parvula, Strain CCMP2471" /LENGTH=481 /DNA_ID=CAMNT_0007498607 /DNA_START=53 /DNA_END=1494 /DNA_ORIENTATION=+
MSDNASMEAVAETHDAAKTAGSRPASASASAPASASALDSQDEQGQRQVSSTRDRLDQKRARDAKKEQTQQSKEGKKRLRMNLGALQRALNLAEAAEGRTEVERMRADAAVEASAREERMVAEIGELKRKLEAAEANARGSSETEVELRQNLAASDAKVGTLVSMEKELRKSMIDVVAELNERTTFAEARVAAAEARSDAAEARSDEAMRLATTMERENKRGLQRTMSRQPSMAAALSDEEFVALKEELAASNAKVIELTRVEQQLRESMIAVVNEFNQRTLAAEARVETAEARADAAELRSDDAMRLATTVQRDEKKRRLSQSAIPAGAGGLIASAAAAAAAGGEGDAAALEEAKRKIVSLREKLAASDAKVETLVAVEKELRKSMMDVVAEFNERTTFAEARVAVAESRADAAEARMDEAMRLATGMQQDERRRRASQGRNLVHLTMPSPSSPMPAATPAGAPAAPSSVVAINTELNAP